MTGSFVLSANVDLLFAEHGGQVGEAGDFVGGRARAAADFGLTAIEIWGWRAKGALLERALRDTGLELTLMSVDPLPSLADPSLRSEFLAALIESRAVAEDLGCPFLVATAGFALDKVPREHQIRSVRDGLSEAAEMLASSQVTLLLENLSSVEHPGVLMDDTRECLEIVSSVGSPNVRLLFDQYHATLMQEMPSEVLAGSVDLVAHVQIADVPGRHEPGTGNIDWSAELAQLHQLGYRGRLGLECFPVRPTQDALQYLLNLRGEEIEVLLG